MTSAHTAGRSGAFFVYCASVSPSVRCVSLIVRQSPGSVSDNVRRKPTFIARQIVLRAATLKENLMLSQQITKTEDEMRRRGGPNA